MSVADLETDLAQARPISRRDAVLGVLRRAIIEGRLAPGERLDPDGIAARLGCSRMPVRDALKALEAEGLVTCYPSRGTEVSRLEPHDIEQLFGIRLALEILALERAVERLTAEDFRRMREILTRMDEPIELDRWLALNEDFHGMINEASGWPRLVAQIDLHRRNIERYVRVRIGQEGLGTPRDEHWDLLAACEARDKARACAILREHLWRTAQLIARQTHDADAPHRKDLDDDL